MTNVPNLRFKGFSEEWENSRLKDISQIYDGTHQTPKYKSSGIKFISVENIKNIYSTDKFISEEDYQKNFKIRPQINDIFMTRITAGEIGATAIVTQEENLAYYVSLALIRGNQTQVSSMFLSYYIASRYFKKELHKRIIHVAFPKKINLGDIGECLIKKPILEEQEKIASFFSLIDKKIKLQTEKVEELKNYKKGIMQKIFSQELRFKDENGNEYPEWEISTIEKIANLEKGFTPDTKDEESWIGDIPWLSIADMKQGKYVANVSKYISNKALGKKHLVPTGTLIMSFKLTIGRLAIVEEPLMTNEAICHFYWKNSNINTEYMYYYLNSVNVESFGCRAAKGITLNNDSLNSIVVKIPVIQEQKKISELLMSVDKKIVKEKEKLERLKQYKQGLLQQMFI